MVSSAMLPLDAVSRCVPSLGFMRGIVHDPYKPYLDQMRGSLVGTVGKSIIANKQTEIVTDNQRKYLLHKVVSSNTALELSYSHLGSNDSISLSWVPQGNNWKPHSGSNDPAVSLGLLSSQYSVLSDSLMDICLGRHVCLLGSKVGLRVALFVNISLNLPAGVWEKRSC